MKTRYLQLLIFALLASIGLSYGQSQTVIAKFIVLDARSNTKDLTQYYTNNKAYFVFYLTADKKVYFGSVVSKLNQQSYGEISELNHSFSPQTSSDYATDTFDFKWSYSNSYDNHQGTAVVRLVKINKPGGTAFTLKVIPDNLDLLEYSGYMEGSLKLD